jgi:hypothetical protein
MPAFGFKIRTGKSLGGGTSTSKTTRSPAAQQINPTIDPRQAPPAQPAVIASGVKTVNTESITCVSGSTVQGQTYNLALMDVITIEIYLVATIGATINASDMASFIDHVQVADGQGGIFANIPGGTFLYDNYSRYATPNGAPVLQSNTIASAATSGTALLVIPNIRIPAAAGGQTGCQLTVFYSAIPASAASATLSSRISVRFGSCGGYATRYQVQTINTASGDNLLQTNSTPQSNLISELFLRSLGSRTYVNYIRIQTNGQVIEQQLYENQIQQRMQDRFPPSSGTTAGNFATTTLVLAEPGQFAMNSTSEFDLNMSSAVNGVQLVWVFYVPAASA